MVQKRIQNAYCMNSSFLFLQSVYFTQAEDVSKNIRANVKVLLTLLDVNDNEPVFVNQPYHALVPVNAGKGHLVVQVKLLEYSIKQP